MKKEQEEKLRRYYVGEQRLQGVIDECNAKGATSMAKHFEIALKIFKDVMSASSAEIKKEADTIYKAKEGVRE